MPQYSKVLLNRGVTIQPDQFSKESTTSSSNDKKGEFVAANPHIRTKQMLYVTLTGMAATDSPQNDAHEQMKTMPSQVTKPQEMQDPSTSKQKTRDP